MAGGDGSWKRRKSSRPDARLTAHPVEHLGHQAHDHLGVERGPQPTRRQAGQPTQLVQRLDDGLRESRHHLVHADAHVHMGHPGAHRGSERRQLGRLTQHQIGAPTLDTRDQRGQGRLRVDPGEHLTKDHVVSLVERHGRQSVHDGADELWRRVGARNVGEPCRSHRTGVRRGSGHPHLVARPRKSTGERLERPEVTVVGRRGAQHTHVIPAYSSSSSPIRARRL